MALLPPGIRGPAIVGTLLAGAYWLTRPKKKKKKKPAFKAPPAPEPEPSPAPSPQPKGEKKWLGTGWTGWPRKDLFPTERSISQALDLLGYGGWGTCMQTTEAGEFWLDNATCRARVRAFQRDFNAVMELLGENLRIDVDGRLGPQTIGTALARALYLAGETEGGVTCTPLTVWPGGLLEPGLRDVCANSWQTLVQAAA